MLVPRIPGILFTAIPPGSSPAIRNFTRAPTMRPKTNRTAMPITHCTVDFQVLHETLEDRLADPMSTGAPRGATRRIRTNDQP